MLYIQYVQPGLAQDESAKGEFRFDLAAQVAGIDNYTKHWSGIYPPDPKADIIIYSYAGNLSYRRMSALGFFYVVYDPFDNIVAVEKIESFKRSYEPSVVYYTLHPESDWMEGNYKIRVIVYDKINRDAWDNITTDPFAIAREPEKYKTFYETGSNAEELGIIQPLGDAVVQAFLYFQIDKSVTTYPPDRFLIRDVRFVDDSMERILGEKLKVEVKVDNNYKDDGEFKLVMMVDNSIVSTQDIAVKGFNTSTVIFDAKAGKIGTFKLHFGADTPDVKYKNAELMFTIKNETESTRLDVPRIEITGMNVDKEFVPLDSSVIVSVTAVNNGKTGTKTITVYSNREPIGSAELNFQYLEEKTVDIPVTLRSMGINRITVSDAPQLYRNVFVQEADGSSLGDSPVMKRLEENPLKVSAVVVLLVFTGVLYYVRKRLLGDEMPQVEAPAKASEEKPKKNRLSGMREYLAGKVQNVKKITRRRP